MAEPASAVAQEPPSQSTEGFGILAGHLEVDSNAPLSGLNTPSTPAYAVRDRLDRNADLFGLVADPRVPVRSDALASLKGQKASGLLPLLNYGPVTWPPDGARRIIAVHPRPRGGTLAAAFADTDKRMRIYDVPRRIIDPLVRGIRGAEVSGVPHRGVRPDNIFFFDAEQTTVVIGDAAMAPAGFNQPFALETIPRAMANPSGRGTGSTADDLYALGVTVMLLVNGLTNVDQPNEEILAEKITKGTAGWLDSRFEIPPALSDLIQGLVADEPDDRWTLPQVEEWLETRKPASAPKRRPPKKAEFPFPFANSSYKDPRLLATAMLREPHEAVGAAASKALLTWLADSLNEPQMAGRIAELAAGTGARGKGLPMDRHIAAFIAARFEYDVDAHLAAMADSRKEAMALGTLSLLALVQWRLKHKPVPALAEWISKNLGPAIATYHSLATRSEIEREIPIVVKRGSLPALYDLVENADKRRADREAYKAARAAFAAAETDIRRTESHDPVADPVQRRVGQRVAATTSVVIALIAIVLSLLSGGV